MGEETGQGEIEKVWGGRVCVCERERERKRERDED